MPLFSLCSLWLLVREPFSQFLQCYCPLILASCNQSSNYQVLLKVNVWLSSGREPHWCNNEVVQEIKEMKKKDNKYGSCKELKPFFVDSYIPCVYFSLIQQNWRERWTDFQHVAMCSATNHWSCGQEELQTHTSLHVLTKVSNSCSLLLSYLYFTISRAASLTMQIVFIR